MYPNAASILMWSKDTDKEPDKGNFQGLTQATQSLTQSSPGLAQVSGGLTQASQGWA